MADPHIIPSEWPETRGFYSNEEVEAFAVLVRKSGLAKARPAKSGKLPKEADPLEALNISSGPKNAADALGE